MNETVKPGVSGRPTIFNAFDVPPEIVACEQALLQLGDFEPLDIKVDRQMFDMQFANFERDWVPYLPRTDRPNNRYGMTLTNLEGKTYRDNPSLAQISIAAGRRVRETEISHPTELFNALGSLSFLHEFGPLGRTFLVKCDVGGYFVPHRDHPGMPRDVFRLAVFLRNCAPLQYDWWADDKKLNIEECRVYYVNTRKTHRTISWTDDSIHLIVNVPFTPENVSKVISHLQHRH